MEEVAVIVILFNPSKEDLEYVKGLSAVQNGYIIDNSSKPSLAEVTGKMHYICNGKNIGIAEAQNIAIREILKDSNFKYIVFFDQDTRVSPQYVNDITQAYKSTRARINNLAILGPTVENKDTQEEYRSVFHDSRADESGFVQQRDVISSGSCVTTDVIKEVGLNEGPLFIDFVDFEWCWRAQSKGYISGTTTKVSIQHKVGKKEIHIGNYHIIVSAPFRYFYLYRNYQWLRRRSYVPKQWKIAQGVKQLINIFVLPLAVKGGFKCSKNAIKGMFYGLFKKEEQL